MIEKFLKNKGIAKTKSQANFIMVIIIIICFIFIGVKMFGGKSSSPQNDLTEEELLGLEESFDSEDPAHSRN